MMDSELRDKHIATLEAIYHTLESAQAMAMDLPDAPYARVLAAIDDAKAKVRGEWTSERERRLLARQDASR